jgi:hypothetical protein
VFALVYSLAHFEENRIIISVFACLCLLFIFTLGDDQISVYSDKVVHSTNSLASLLFQSKGKIYFIKEINKAYLKTEEEKMPNAFEVGFIVLLVALLPNGNRSNNATPIYFDTNTGETWRLNTNLSHKQMKNVVGTVNALIRKSGY